MFLRTSVRPLAAAGGIFLVTFLLSGVALDGSPDRVATGFALALLSGMVAALVALAWGAPRALAWTLSGLVAVAALLAARPADSVALLGGLVRSTLPWATVACAGPGIVLLTVLWRRSPPATPARRWGSVAVYALATLGLAGWAAWAGLDQMLAGLQGARTIERQAGDLLPLVIALGAACQLVLAALLPAARWRRAATADLVALLALLALPLVAGVVSRRVPLFAEGRYHVAWIAMALAVLVALRVTVAILALRDVAARGQVGDRRLALALLVVCLAAYGTAAAWRFTGVKFTGDEQEYLAAAMSLWRNGNLEITDSIFSPEMGRLVLNPGPAGDQRPDIYEDQTRDRLATSLPGAAGTALYLPVVGGHGLSGRLAVLNRGLEPAGITVRYRGETGAGVGAQELAVPAGGAAQLSVPPDDGEGWVSAAIEAGKPVSVAVRLADADGEETYTGAVAIPRHCLPLDVPGARWRVDLVIQNPQPTPTTLTWQYLDRDGTRVTEQRATVPPRGVAGAPLPAPAGIGTVCIVADSPVSTVAVLRGEPGLLVQQARGAQSDPIPVPDPPRAFNIRSETEVLLYNPNPDPVQVKVAGPDGPRGATVTIPARGTRQFVFPLGGWAWDDPARADSLAPDGPVVAAIIGRAGAQMAAMPAGGVPSRTPAIPLVADDGERYTLAQLRLTNTGTATTGIVARVRNADGHLFWQEKADLCPGCSLLRLFWYKGQTEGALTVEASEPVGASLVERQVQTGWPYHGVGLSLALVPGYALAGYRGALATAALLAALLAAATYALARRLGVPPRRALVTTAILALSPPLTTYATQLYPEIGGTLLIVLAALLIDGAVAGGRRAHWRLLPAALCVAGALLFHGRLLPLALALALAYLLALATRLLPRTRATEAPIERRAAATGLLAGTVVLALAIGLLMFLEPRIRPAHLRQYFSLEAVGLHLLGSLLDRTTGLLPRAPALLLAFGGLAGLLRDRRDRPFLAWCVPVLAAAQLAAVAVRQSGWEAFGPAGRYLLPAVPFLAVGLATAWERDLVRPVRSLALAGATWSLLLAIFYAAAPFVAYYGVTPIASFTDDVLTALTGTTPFRLFPTLQAATLPARGEVVHGLLLLAAGILLSLPWRELLLRRGHGPSAAAQGPPAAGAAMPRAPWRPSTGLTCGAGAAPPGPPDPGGEDAGCPWGGPAPAGADHRGVEPVSSPPGSGGPGGAAPAPRA